MSMGPDSAVGIATGYMLDDRLVESRKYQDFSHLHFTQTASGALPASYQMCNGGSFPGGKEAWE
jgi:hypothetical protein